MGSEIITAIVEQKGQISTNPGSFSPSSSRPIEQRDPTPATLAPSEIIQQISTIATAKDGNTELSKPIEQQEGDKFNEAQSRPDDCFIEQKNSTRDSLGSDTPIEQQIFVTNNLRVITTGNSQMEQRNLSRDIVGANPIQQEPKKVNTINVTQFDFVELIFPLCGSTKNPITTNILWRIRDFGFPFDVETLIFRVDGVQVQDSSNFSVTALVGGLQLDYDPPEAFDFGVTVNIILEISDNADPPNDFLYRCSWDTVEDSRPPVITLISPECNETNVGVQEPVVFSVFDAGEGVELDSIKLSIEGIPVCDGLTFDPITTVSGGGFTVTWDHLDDPFRFESSVSVGIEATDLSELQNSALFVCCFQTEESSVPEFLNWDPLQCATFVDNTTGLSFEVYGNVDGVDISTLEVRIDNKLRKVFVRPRILRSE
jgi:hypothetical protein